MGNTVQVSVVADVAKLRQGMQRANQQLDGFAKGAKRAGVAVAGALVGAQVVGGIKNVVRAASEAQQSVGAIGSVYKQHADGVVADSKRAAQEVGLSANAYREQAALLGALFKGQGVEQDKLRGKTRQMIGVAADLAATFGGTTKDAVDALSSAFKGETDPIEKYGISIKQSDVTARLAAKGQDKLTGAAKKAAEQQARTALILAGAKDAQGQFGRESNTLAGAQQRLGAQLDNLKASVGERLLPALARGATFLADNLPAGIDKAKAAAQAMVPYLEGIRDAVVTFGPAVAAAVVSFLLITKTLAAYKAVVAAVKAAQIALNVAMASNPAVLIALGIAAVVAALVLAYQHSDRFRAIVNAVGAALKGAWLKVLPVLKAAFAATFKAVGAALRGAAAVVMWAVNRIVGNIRAIVAAAKWVAAGVRAGFSAVSSAASSLAGAVGRAVGKVTAWFRGVKAKVMGALSGAGSWLLETGRNVVQGLIRGISSLASSVTSALLNLLPGPLRKFAHKLGIRSPSRVFRKFGGWITQGLALGITAEAGAVDKSLKMLADRIKKHGGDAAAKLLKSDLYVKGAKRLEAYAKAYDKVLGKLDAERDKLKQLVEARASYAAGVADSARGYASVVGLNAAEDGSQTAAGIIQGMRDRVAAIRNYSDKLAQLLKAGLNKTTYDQLVQAGVEGGTATVEALAAGGSGAVSEVNKLQSQVNAASAQLGNSTASAMHDAGIKAQQGLIRGLEADASKIARASSRFARKLVKAVKKELGIKSPSRVFRGIGGNVTQGLELGLAPDVIARKGAQLAGALTRGFGSPGLEAGLAFEGPAAGGRNYSITVHAPVGASSADIGRELVKHVRAYERTVGVR